MRHGIRRPKGYPGSPRTQDTEHDTGNLRPGHPDSVREMVERDERETLAAKPPAQK